MTETDSKRSILRSMSKFNCTGWPIFFLLFSSTMIIASISLMAVPDQPRVVRIGACMFGLAGLGVVSGVLGMFRLRIAEQLALVLMFTAAFLAIIEMVLKIF